MVNGVKSFLSRGSFARNIMLAAVVLGIPLTVFVAQQAQEVRQHASEIPVTPTISVTPGSVGPYKISGRVFVDKNDDSQVQDTEGMANVPVKVVNENNDLVVTLTTNEQGFYQAMVSDPGAYLISAGGVSGYEYTSPNPKLITVKGTCPTATPLPATSTPTAAPSETPLPTNTLAPSATTIPSATPLPTVVDDTNATTSAGVQGAQDAVCMFEFTANFTLEQRPGATSIPTPTIDACRVGLTSITVNTYCGDGQYRYVEFQCANGATGKLGGETTCKTMDSWYGYARNSCQKQSSCPVTPTRRPTITLTPSPLPSSTPKPSATPTPTHTPTPLPTATPFPRQACDINGNGKIGEEDFFKMVSCFRKNDCNAKDKLRSDLNKDGTVTFTDLNIFFKECRVTSR